jgi:sugar lactone lactonase YvrE
MVRISQPAATSRVVDPHAALRNGVDSLSAMTRLRLLSAIAAAVSVAACAADGDAARTCDDSGYDWVYSADTDRRRLDLFVYRGGEHVQLTDDGASGYPAAAPDGSRVAFTRGTGSYEECCGFPEHELWTTDLDGDATVLLDGGLIVAPAWSPDGRRIAYLQEDPDTGASGIVVTTVDGGAQETVSEGALGWWRSEPSWSPDGTALAWVALEDDAIVTLDLASGRTRTHPVDDHVTDIDGPLAWTPDGAGFLVAGHSASALDVDTGRLFRVDAATGEAEAVAENVTIPVLTPDGRIAGVRGDRSGEEYELVIMNADGTDLEHVTDLPNTFLYNSVRVAPVQC